MPSIELSTPHLSWGHNGISPVLPSSTGNWSCYPLRFVVFKNIYFSFNLNEFENPIAFKLGFERVSFPLRSESHSWTPVLWLWGLNNWQLARWKGARAPTSALNLRMRQRLKNCTVVTNLPIEIAERSFSATHFYWWSLHYANLNLPTYGFICQLNMHLWSSVLPNGHDTGSH